MININNFNCTNNIIETFRITDASAENITRWGHLLMMSHIQVKRVSGLVKIHAKGYRVFIMTGGGCKNICVASFMNAPLSSKNVLIAKNRATYLEHHSPRS